MIVVDTSALMAILLDEPPADACAAALAGADRLLVSAVTVAEALVVAGARNVGPEMARLIEGAGFEVVAATVATAGRVAAAYRTFGKGVHPAGLNFGDCFAYALATEHAAPLLFVGNDFAHTDVGRVLGAGG